MEKCVNCQYYDRRNTKRADGTTPMLGQCRRHSPRLNPATAKAYVVEGVWPVVRDDDWCGEWTGVTRSVNAFVRHEPRAAAAEIPGRGPLAPNAAVLEEPLAVPGND